MTAEEMFKELGYECTRNDEQEIVYIIDGEGDSLTFCKKNKEIEVRLLTMGKKYVVNYHYSIEEINAIQKQVEELGW